MKTIFFWIAMGVIGLTSFTGHSENLNTKRAVKMETQAPFSNGEIVSGYLKIKNALVKSDSKAATQAAKSLEATLASSDLSKLPSEQKSVVESILKQAIKEAKTLMANSGKIDRQRKAFQMLSLKINDLVTMFDSPQKIYVDFCPMYEGGSIWLSETKDIKNPYYGAQMLTCGRIKETAE